MLTVNCKGEHFFKWNYVVKQYEKYILWNCLYYGYKIQFKLSKMFALIVNLTPKL